MSNIKSFEDLSFFKDFNYETIKNPNNRTNEEIFELLKPINFFYYKYEDTSENNLRNISDDIDEEYLSCLDSFLTHRKLSDKLIIRIIKYFDDLMNDSCNFFESMYIYQTISFDILRKYDFDWYYITKFQTHIENNDDFEFEMRDRIKWNCYTKRNFRKSILEYTPELYKKLFKFRDYVNWFKLSKTLILLPEYFLDDSKDVENFRLKNTKYYNMYKNRLQKIIKLQKTVTHYLYKPKGKMYIKHEKHFYSL